MDHLHKYDCACAGAGVVCLVGKQTDCERATCLTPQGFARLICLKMRCFRLQAAVSIERESSNFSEIPPAIVA